LLRDGESYVPTLATSTAPHLTAGWHRSARNGHVRFEDLTHRWLCDQLYELEQWAIRGRTPDFDNLSDWIKRVYRGASADLIAA
jgi:hypothetical protein